MTHLRVVGHEDHSSDDQLPFAAIALLLDGVLLEEVTTLDCSSNSPGRGRFHAIVALSTIFPNLAELDLSNMVPRAAPTLLAEFAERCPSLAKITWNNSCQYMYQCGHELRRATNLTHLYVDGIKFSRRTTIDEVGFTTVLASNRPDCYLFMKCHNLVHLSIKGATVWIPSEDEAHPLSQDDLINMVRRHPTLRWLRSDLTAENAAMLKQERLEITFVSD